jgi:BirA family transcriptional regulator, biotin operon repressor / biotin---[acetyl-CoA-carboxylase] ligase
LKSSLSETPLPSDLRAAIDDARPRLGLCGAHVHYSQSIGSSNDIALRFAESGAPEGTVVIAGAQTAGRGRRGHDWFSPPGAGLYVSIVFRPGGWQPRGNGQTLLTLAAAVALAEGIRISTGLEPEIKWPNDLIVGRRKLAGILAEAAGAEPPFDHIVLGFGVNLSRASYPASIASRATSIEHELGRVPDRGVVCAEVLAALASWYASLAAGRFDAILSRWTQLSPSSRGALVEWVTPQGVASGKTAGVDGDGALLVETANGVQRVVGGEVRWLQR